MSSYICGKCKETSVGHLEENKIRLRLPNKSIYYKATMIKAVSFSSMY
jgi:hypothetical protein